MPDLKPTLLLVDDNPDNLRVLSTILGGQGYRVRKAINGEMALETVQAELPDLILLDIKMPDIDGYTVCARLKAEAHTSKVPIIFLSALDDPVDKVKAFTAGGTDYITKPFQAEEVLVRIRHQLTIQQQQRQLNEHNQRLQQEIQERQQAQSETQLLLDTIQAVNQASDFEDALQQILCRVRPVINWEYSEAWVAQHNDFTLHLCRACYDFNETRLQEFHATRCDETIEYDLDTLNQVHVLQIDQSDTAIDPSVLTLFQPERASAAHFKTAFSVPIRLEEQLIAVLVFFNSSHLACDVHLLNLINAVGVQLGNFMQRKLAEEALKQAIRELRRIANLDGLTQVANRRCFDERLEQEWRRLLREQAPIGLMLCDIDYFKRYNDHYGHPAGDVCLRRVAQTIAKVCKRPADLVARYGGEEFAVLLPNTELVGVIELAEQMQEAIASLGISHDSSCIGKQVTLSIGIASILPTIQSSPEGLISAADSALYEAKARGRNTYCVSHSLASSTLSPTPLSPLSTNYEPSSMLEQ
ncbi:MAG TPA: diguanylate cyclase [Crinalium sp.]|jgi:diguanylate cyclase (GGDEF)-like protein